MKSNYSYALYTLATLFDLKPSPNIFYPFVHASLNFSILPHWLLWLFFSSPHYFKFYFLFILLILRAAAGFLSNLAYIPTIKRIIMQSRSLLPAETVETIFCFLAAPSSPVHHNRRLLLSARNIRMNSVELPDENEKSQSSASASPCPSPVRFVPLLLYSVYYLIRICLCNRSPLYILLEFSILEQKAQRLLPTNLYVVLFNFKGREADELDLK